MSYYSVATKPASINFSGRTARKQISKTGAEVPGMDLPEIDLEELERLKEKNFRDRLAFQDRYIEWLKKKNNSEWSAAQKSIINRKSD